MKQRLTILALMLIVWCMPAAMGEPWNAAPQEKRDSQKAPAKSAPKAAQASLAGCVDQAEDGKYILIHEKTRDLVANLVAEGFPVEGFAKHLGQKVTVRGTPGTDGSSPSFRVRSIEVISEGCAAQ